MTPEGKYLISLSHFSFFSSHAELTPSSSGATSADSSTLVQYLVVVSEKSAKVIQMPTQFQVASLRLSEESNIFVIKAALTNIKGFILIVNYVKIVNFPIEGNNNYC